MQAAVHHLFIDRAINEWHQRLECIVQQERHIETLNVNETVKIAVHGHNLECF